MNPEAEQTLRQADAEFSYAWEAKDVEAIVRFFAEDAVMLAVSNPVLAGATAIRRLLSQLLSLRGFSTRLEFRQAVVSGSGDLGYTLGTYQTRMTGSAGRTVTHKGKYVAVWKKQANGSWKVVVHSSNPN